MCRFGGGGCREEFRLRVETRRRGRIGNVQRVHMLVGNVHRRVWGIFIPHCNTLPSLVYKRREGSLVEGLPILSHKGIPFLSRVISSRVSSRVCNILCSLLLLLEKFGPPQSWQQSSVRVRVLLLVLLRRYVC